MKINTIQKLKDLEEKDMEITVGKALANIVLMVKSDPLRSYVMATSLYKEKSIELSKADYDFVKSAIIEHGREVYGNNLIQGQLLSILSEFKESKV